MAKKKNSMETHQFYCINCGQRGIDLIRQVGFKRTKFHRKKLWCINCKAEVNHVECKTPEEVEQFKIDFSKGVYKDEAEESLAYMWSTSQR